MRLLGSNAEDTAMAKTVGLPLGILVRLLMEGKVKTRGVHIPVLKEVYEPILDELRTFGITFTEQEIDIS